MARFGLSQVMERVVHAREPIPVEIREVLSEETFRRMIAVERKRTERSNEPFLLMLLEGSCLESSGGTECALRRIVSALLSTTRDTDLIGWYDKGPTVGVLYTGLSVDKKSIVLSTILNKVSAALGAQLSSTELSQVSISFHFFPDEWHQENSGHPNNPVLYPDLLIKVRRKRVALAVKRTLDTVGSALLLLLSAPLMLLIAIAVKLSSAGPVLFKQQRVGRNGKVFTFLKFRSMFVNNDEAVHKDFVSRLIANNALPEEPPGRREAIYKLRGVG